jgi:threonine dehydratase
MQAPLRHEPVGRWDAEEARDRLGASGAIRTPLVRLNVELADREIYLKLENLQPIGSFKLRGMWNGVASCPPAEIAHGVWTLSAGNAAQGLAWSARRLGVSCTVVAPDNAPRAKLDAVERLGARIVTVPIADWFVYAADRAYPGLRAHLVHPFSDRAVMAGNGTIALEILEDLPDVDAVLVPWGGGGLTCGIAGVLHEMRPGVRVDACEFAPTAPLRASLDAGAVAEVPYVETFVDGIGAPRTFAEMFALAQSLQVGSLVSALDQVAAALRLIAERNHVVVEGAAAVPVAAALSGAAGDGRIVCVVSGGNIDLEKFAGLVTQTVDQPTG